MPVKEPPPGFEQVVDAIESAGGRRVTTVEVAGPARMGYTPPAETFRLHPGRLADTDLAALKSALDPSRAEILGAGETFILGNVTFQNGVEPPAPPAGYSDIGIRAFTPFTRAGRSQPALTVAAMNAAPNLSTTANGAAAGNMPPRRTRFNDVL